MTAMFYPRRVPHRVAPATFGGKFGFIELAVRCSPLLGLSRGGRVKSAWGAQNQHNLHVGHENGSDLARGNQVRAIDQLCATRDSNPEPAG
jgi:hypothetical protein